MKTQIFDKTNYAFKGYAKIILAHLFMDQF